MLRLSSSNGARSSSDNALLDKFCSNQNEEAKSYTMAKTDASDELLDLGQNIRTEDGRVSYEERTVSGPLVRKGE